jgi:phenylpyruvate tautomerase PptA (4-oxalocrotonate tautomerase family)
MPFVRIEMLSGRSTEQKTRLAVAITNIVFVDVARDDWAVAGKLIVDG